MRDAPPSPVMLSASMPAGRPSANLPEVRPGHVSSPGKPCGPCAFPARSGRRPLCFPPWPLSSAVERTAMISWSARSSAAGDAGEMSETGGVRHRLGPEPESSVLAAPLQGRLYGGSRRSASACGRGLAFADTTRVSRFPSGPGLVHARRRAIGKPWCIAVFRADGGAPLVLGVGDDDLAVRELDLVAGTAVHHLGRGDDAGRPAVGPEQVITDRHLAHRRPPCGSW